MQNHTHTNIPAGYAHTHTSTLVRRSRKASIFSSQKIEPEPSDVFTIETKKEGCVSDTYIHTYIHTYIDAIKEEECVSAGLVHTYIHTYIHTTQERRVCRRFS